MQERRLCGAWIGPFATGLLEKPSIDRGNYWSSRPIKEALKT
jgi:hypothetical protein